MSDVKFTRDDWDLGMAAYEDPDGNFIYDLIISLDYSKCNHMSATSFVIRHAFEGRLTEEEEKDLYEKMKEDAYSKEDRFSNEWVEMGVSPVKVLDKDD